MKTINVVFAIIALLLFVGCGNQKTETQNEELVVLDFKINGLIKSSDDINIEVVSIDSVKPGKYQILVEDFDLIVSSKNLIKTYSIDQTLNAEGMVETEFELKGFEAYGFLLKPFPYEAIDLIEELSMKDFNSVDVIDLSMFDDRSQKCTVKLSNFGPGMSYEYSIVFDNNRTTVDLLSTIWQGVPIDLENVLD